MDWACESQLQMERMGEWGGAGDAVRVLPGQDAVRVSPGQDAVRVSPREDAVRVSPGQEMP